MYVSSDSVVVAQATFTPVNLSTIIAFNASVSMHNYVNNHDHCLLLINQRFTYVSVYGGNIRKGVLGKYLIHISCHVHVYMDTILFVFSPFNMPWLLKVFQIRT